MQTIILKDRETGQGKATLVLNRKWQNESVYKVYVGQEYLGTIDRKEDIEGRVSWMASTATGAGRGGYKCKNRKQALGFILPREVYHSIF